MEYEKFNDVFDLFLNKSILTLRKYEKDNFNVYEFNKEDLQKIIDLKIIDSIPSIYILEDTERKKYYVGETDNFLKRIKVHENKKDKNFNKIYVINSSILNKNICLELESKTIESFKNSVNTYNVVNINEHNNSYLSSADKLKFKSYWKTFKKIYFLLKFNLNPKKNNKFDNNELIFYYKKAKMKIVEGGYLLLEGSKIFDKEWKYGEKTRGRRAIKIKEELIKNNKIDSGNKLKENLFDNYPSPLGSLISGSPTNGYFVWKTKDGKTLNEYLRRDK